MAHFCKRREVSNRLNFIFLPKMIVVLLTAFPLIVPARLNIVFFRPLSLLAMS